MKWLATCVVIFVSLASFCGANQHPWQNGKTETLWRQRYGNCDYGMFVLLPAGVVAHGTLPPSPNHGVAIRLPDVSSTSDIDVSTEKRYVWVNAEYNMSEDSSRRGTVTYYSSVFTEGKRGKLTKQMARLGSLPATRLTFTYESPNGTVIEEMILAQRATILYEIGLRTMKQNYQDDVTRFEQLNRGFRLSPLPKGVCSNG